MKHLPLVLLAAAPVAELFIHQKKDHELHAHPEATHPFLIPTGVKVYGNINYDQVNHSQKHTEARLVTLFMNDQS